MPSFSSRTLYYFRTVLRGNLIASSIPAKATGLAKPQLGSGCLARLCITTTEAAALFAVFERCALRRPGARGFSFGEEVRRQAERLHQLACIATQRKPQSSTHLIRSCGTELGHTFPPGAVATPSLHCAGSRRTGTSCRPPRSERFPGTPQDGTTRIVEVIGAR
jgi:hypothetical protein